MKSKFPKLLLFILSMAPFFIILGLMTMDIPISFSGDAEFIGWDALWQNTRVGVFIIVLSVIGELLVLLLFSRVCGKVAGEQAERVEKISNKNFELISFVTSIFLPLISFQYDQLSHWVVTLLIVIIIGYIFCTSDGYFTNPTLALFGYRLYNVNLSNQNKVNPQTRDLTILSKTLLQEGDNVRCYKLTDKVSLARKSIKTTDNTSKA